MGIEELEVYPPSCVNSRGYVNLNPKTIEVFITDFEACQDTPFGLSFEVPYYNLTLVLTPHSVTKLLSIAKRMGYITQTDTP